MSATLCPSCGYRHKHPSRKPSMECIDTLRSQLADSRNDELERLREIVRKLRLINRTLRAARPPLFAPGERPRLLNRERKAAAA
jgi:hypothetical protein